MPENRAAGKKGGGIARKANEFSKELLWQELPTDQRSSYFREFWDINGNTEPSIIPKKKRNKGTV